MDKKDEIILQQLDVIRSMTERNLRSMNADFWGTPLSPADKTPEKAPDKTPEKAPHKKSGGPEQQTEAPEPLPKDDPLWDARNIILTPHVSGNMTLGYTCDRNVELFCTDLKNYAAGRPLAGLVDRARGY